MLFDLKTKKHKKAKEESCGGGGGRKRWGGVNETTFTIPALVALTALRILMTSICFSSARRVWLAGSLSRLNKGVRQLATTLAMTAVSLTT